MSQLNLIKIYNMDFCRPNMQHTWWNNLMIESQSPSEETEMQNQKRNLEIQDFLS